MRNLVLVVLVASSLVAPPLANALVMCGPKKPDGTLRDGASIKLRTACRSSELQLDPVALGLQGPAGPTGPQGEVGPVGPSAGARVVDATGTYVGAAVIDDSVPKAIVQTDDLAVLVPWDFFYGWFGGEVYFETPDCTGTPYIQISTTMFLQTYTPIRLGAVVDHTVYRAGAPSYSNLLAQSYLSNANVPLCDPGQERSAMSCCFPTGGTGGSFTPASTAELPATLARPLRIAAY